jgi:hypothetical protein
MLFPILDSLSLPFCFVDFKFVLLREDDEPKKDAASAPHLDALAISTRTNAAKVAAKKTAKSAETKAKKAKKALTDADESCVRREQTIAKRLDKISALVVGKYRAVPFLCTCSCFYLLIFAHFLLSLSSLF